jgi:hypothetical protein
MINYVAYIITTLLSGIRINWHELLSTWKVLKSGAGGGWKRSVGLIM